MIIWVFRPKTTVPVCLNKTGGVYLCSAVCLSFVLQVTGKVVTQIKLKASVG